MQFNQSSRGVDNWGDLENLIEKGVTRCCVFAGPLFAADDPMFEGQDNTGKTKVCLPRAFWKVVVEVDAVSGRLASYAFELRQDLTDVQLTELEVPARWDKTRRRLADLDAKLPLLTLPMAVRDADVLAP